jgi:gliding motility-associated-like protein
MKQITTAGEGWDGTFNKTPLPADDYWFTIEYQEQGVTKIFKSHFALKR